jgi:hypothetical protein
MKKRGRNMQKKYIKIAGFTVLILALLGGWGYNRYFKPNPEIAQQLNNQFGTEFFTSFTDESTAAEPAVVNTPITTTVLDKIEANRSIQNAATPVNANIPPAQSTEEVIIQKYAPQFQSLENMGSSRLDVLVAAALQEYRQQKMAGTLNAPELVRKYMQAGNMLEASVDSQFNSTLNAMQAELVANNQSTAVIADIKQEYAAAKAKERSALLAKAHR